MLASVDGVVLPVERATIPLTADDLLGDGVSELVRIYRGRPFALAAHMERMASSAAKLRLPLDRDVIAAEASALLAASDEPDALLRIVATRRGHRIAIIEPLTESPDTLALHSVTSGSNPVLDCTGSLSRAADGLATRTAQEHGADAALLVTPQGHVREGATSSFFCSLDGHALITPSPDEGICDSITRRLLLELGLAIEERIDAAELPRASEAFLASTVSEVQPVHAIDGRRLPWSPGPLTRDAHWRLRRHIARELGTSRHPP